MESTKLDNDRKVLIIVVIEPKINHLIGYYIQFLSLQTLEQNVEYRLCIIDKEIGLVSEFIQFFIKNGIKPSLVKSTFKNPYLNKYLFLKSFNDLQIFNYILLLDWDIIYTGQKKIPMIPNNFLGARLNPSRLYANIIHNGFHSTTLNKYINREIPTSINSGVLLGNETVFKKLEKTIISLINNDIFFSKIQNL